MSIGAMDKRVQVLKISKAQNGTGEMVNSSADGGTVWCAIKSLGGSEAVVGGQVNAMNTKVFEVRWISGLSEKDVLVYDGDKYDILHIEEVGRKCYQRIRARKNDSQNWPTT